MVVAGALVALAGCGSSKPAYCSDRTNLNNAVNNLPSVASSSGISGLASQVTTIKNDATSLVNAAKSDFPTETSAVKTSVDTLASAVKALPSSPSSSQTEREAERGGRELRSHLPAAAPRGEILPRRAISCAGLAVQLLR
jgi:hypothetical protein